MKERQSETIAAYLLVGLPVFPHWDAWLAIYGIGDTLNHFVFVLRSNRQAGNEDD